MKKKIFIIIITLLLIFPISVNAQTLKLTDKHINHAEYNNKYLTMFNKYDNNGKVNGFIVIEEYTKEIDSYYTNQMIKVFNNNNQLEKIYYEDELILSNQEPTKENPLVFYNFDDYDDNLNTPSRGKSDVSIIMYDDTDITKKQIKWTAQFGGSQYDEFFFAIKDYENNKHTGYIFIGATESIDLHGITVGYIEVKYDLNGKLVWQKNINVDEYEYEFLPSYSKDGKIDGVLITETGMLIKINLNNDYVFEKFQSSGRMYSVTYSRDKNDKIIGYTTIGNTCGRVDKRDISEIQKRVLNPKIKDVNYKENNTYPKLKNIVQEICLPIITKFDLDGNILQEKVIEN